MNLIQLVLILLLIAGFVIYFRSIRSRMLDRLLVAAIILIGIVMVLWPEMTNVAADLFGVGRGADLVIYFGLVGLGFITALLYLKLRDTEERLTELTRTIALKNAQEPGDKSLRNE